MRVTLVGVPRSAAAVAPVFFVAVHAVVPDPVNGVPVAPTMVIVPPAAIAVPAVNWNTAGAGVTPVTYEAGIAVTSVMLGAAVGAAVGCVGAFVGACVGTSDGAELGAVLGAAVGATLGATLGAAVGACVGA